MLKCIPHTERRYVVDITSGDVFDQLANEQLSAVVTPQGRVYKEIAGLETIFEDGVLAGVLVMHAINDITIPAHLWRRLTVDYCNGNVLDVHPRNLYWRFTDGPIESQAYPGFYYVPEYKYILVSKDSRVLSFAPGPALSREKALSEAATRYRDVSVVATNGKGRSCPSHRLTALALCHRPGNPDFLVTNHIDGGRDLDHYNNLEFVTYQINLIHGHLMKGINNVIVTLPNGDVHTHHTLSSIADILAVSPADVWVAMRHNDGVIADHRVGLTLPVNLSDESMRYLQSKAQLGYSQTTLYLRRLSDQRIMKFQSIAELAAHLNVKTNRIDHHLATKPSNHAFDKTWLITADSHAMEMDDSLVILAEPGSGRKKVNVLCEDTGITTCYDSAMDAIRALGLSKKVVTVSLKRNDRRLINGYRFSYMSD